MEKDNPADYAAAASELAMNVHVIRRTEELLRQRGQVPLLRNDAELRGAAERQLSSITGLELVYALLEIRRVTGVPFKL